jgi:hypothetical protein
MVDGEGVTERGGGGTWPYRVPQASLPGQGGPPQVGVGVPRRGVTHDHLPHSGPPCVTQRPSEPSQGKQQGTVEPGTGGACARATHTTCLLDTGSELGHYWACKGEAPLIRPRVSRTGHMGVGA